jgi:hypothetical protein
MVDGLEILTGQQCFWRERKGAWIVDTSLKLSDIDVLQISFIQHGKNLRIINTFFQNFARHAMDPIFVTGPGITFRTVGDWGQIGLVTCQQGQPPATIRSHNHRSTISEEGVYQRFPGYLRQSS